MKARYGIGLIMGLAAGVLAGYHAGSVRHCGGCGGSVWQEELRETATDTLRQRNPEARAAVAEVRREIVRLRRGATQVATENSESSEQSENSEGGGSVERDSAEVEIPIEQSVYEDSTYRAWVSGYRARLDSIEVYARRETVTVTRTTRQPRRWGIGITAGYGYGTKGFQPYVGIGITYSIFSF